MCHYEGSLVSFYYNRQAVGTYKGGGVYAPPSPSRLSLRFELHVGSGEFAAANAEA